MTKRKSVTVIDYGMGNIWSVKAAFEYLNCDVVVTGDPQLIANCDRLVLPGVGSFKLAMESILRLGIKDAIAEFANQKQRNILGICLGHQAIAEAFGGKLHNLADVQHGVASTLTVVSDRLFEGLPTQFAVGRYHSWVVDESQLPAELEVIGRTTDQQIMAIRHRQFDLRGLQFHPESILTEHGAKLIQNWLQN